MEVASTRRQSRREVSLLVLIHYLLLSFRTIGAKATIMEGKSGNEGGPQTRAGICGICASRELSVPPAQLKRGSARCFGFLPTCLCGGGTSSPDRSARLPLRFWCRSSIPFTPVLSSHSLPHPGANSGKSRCAEFPFSWLRSGFGSFRESGWSVIAEDLIQLPL